MRLIRLPILILTVISLLLPNFADARRGRVNNHQSDLSQIKALSMAGSLSTWELAMQPELFSAYLFANIMSSNLWALREKMPSRSPDGELHSFKRRFNDLSTYVRTHVSYPRYSTDRPETDIWGWFSIEEGMQMFDNDKFQSAIDFLDGLLKMEPDDKSSVALLNNELYQNGYRPYWRNEIFDLMLAYQIDGSPRAVGKCYAFALLMASTLNIVCEVPLEKIYLLGNSEHTVVFVDEDDGYIFSLYAWRDRASERRRFGQPRFSSKEWWASFFQRINFVVNGANYYDGLSSVSTMSKDRLEYIYQRIVYFEEGYNEINVPDFEEVSYLAPFSDINIQEFIDSGDLEGLVSRIRELGGGPDNSPFKSALHAFRYIDIENPQSYAVAALRDPHAKEKAKEVISIQTAIDIIKSIEGDSSIFGSLNRIALPDEVLNFNTANHRDKALLLYTLIAHSLNENKDKTSYMIFTNEKSFVFFDGKLIDVSSGEYVENITGIPLLIFNEEECFETSVERYEVN